jgi:hypothetical protein
MPQKSEALRATIFKIQSNKARWKMMKITTIMNRDDVAWNLTSFQTNLYDLIDLIDPKIILTNSENVV